LIVSILLCGYASVRLPFRRTALINAGMIMVILGMLLISRYWPEVGADAPYETLSRLGHPTILSLAALNATSSSAAWVRPTLPW
jgi:hypothetical protein